MTAAKPIHRFNSAIGTAQNYLRYVGDRRLIFMHRAKLIALAKANVGLALGAANEMRDPVRRALCLRILSRLRAAAACAKREADTAKVEAFEAASPPSDRSN